MAARGNPARRLPLHAPSRLFLRSGLYFGPASRPKNPESSDGRARAGKTSIRYSPLVANRACSGSLTVAPSALRKHQIGEELENMPSLPRLAGCTPPPSQPPREAATRSTGRMPFELGTTVGWSSAPAFQRLYFERRSRRVISDATFDLMRERWRETIPEQYRFNEKTTRTDRRGRSIQPEANRHLSSAIILPVPPKPLCRWFWCFERHITEQQKAAKYAPRNGRHVQHTPPQQRDHRRATPSLPSLSPPPPLPPPSLALTVSSFAEYSAKCKELLLRQTLL